MKVLLSLLIVMLFSFNSFSQAIGIDFIELGVSGFDQPVDVVNTYIDGDDRLFVVEKTGKIVIVSNVIDTLGLEEKLATPFLDLSDRVAAVSEAGLLGLAFHPDYENNGYFFIYYNDYINGSSGQIQSNISRFTVDPNDSNIADPESELIVFQVDQPARNHDGGELFFGADGYLYIPLGDGGGANDQFNNANDGQSPLGKILRLDINEEPYTIPAENPFIGNDEVMDEIWSLGWRNPWKTTYDRSRDMIWAADVGQNKFEEVNIVDPNDNSGHHYGWACYEGYDIFNQNKCIDSINYIEPIFTYGRDKGISITGGLAYQGYFTPYVGNYFFTDFASGRLWMTTEGEDGTFSTEEVDDDVLLTPLPLQVASFGEDSESNLYMSSFNGKVYRFDFYITTSNEDVAIDAVTIFPNPASEKLTLQSDSQIISDVKFYGIDGKQLSPIQITDNEYNVSTLPSGMIMVSYNVNGKERIQKVMIK